MPQNPTSKFEVQAAQYSNFVLGQDTGVLFEGAQATTTSGQISSFTKQDAATEIVDSTPSGVISMVNQFGGVSCNLWEKMFCPVKKSIHPNLFVDFGDGQDVRLCTQGTYYLIARTDIDATEVLGTLTLKGSVCFSQWQNQSMGLIPPFVISQDILSVSAATVLPASSSNAYLPFSILGQFGASGLVLTTVGSQTSLLYPAGYYEVSYNFTCNAGTSGSGNQGRISMWNIITFLTPVGETVPTQSFNTIAQFQAQATVQTLYATVNGIFSFSSSTDFVLTNEMFPLIYNGSDYTTFPSVMKDTEPVASNPTVSQMVVTQWQQFAIPNPVESGKMYKKKVVQVRGHYFPAALTTIKFDDEEGQRGLCQYCLYLKMKQFMYYLGISNLMPEWDQNRVAEVYSTIQEFADWLSGEDDSSLTGCKGVVLKLLVNGFISFCPGGRYSAMFAGVVATKEKLWEISAESRVVKNCKICQGEMAKMKNVIF